MMDISFYLFLAMCQLLLVLTIIVIAQAVFLKKYRPYFLSNTKPEAFLKKYLQHLINRTQKFSNGLEKSADNGDKTATQTCQQLSARLNWLILERDNISTENFDIRYWENISNHIKDMLAHWEAVEYIQEPPDLAKIQLLINGHKENFDYENANVDQAIKDQISALKKKTDTMSKYESEHNELKIAYNMLEADYSNLMKTTGEFTLETADANKLKAIMAEHEAKQQDIA